MKKILFGIMVVIALAVYSVGLMQFADKKQSAEARHTAEEVNAKYIAKEHNGKIAVFIEADKTPFKILKIDIDNLTAYDKKQFAVGIPLNSIEEVLLLEEDFSS